MLGVPDADSLAPVACWPAGSSASDGLLATARTAMEQRRGIVNSNGDATTSGAERIDTIACPLTISNQVIGIVALEVASRPEDQQRAVMQLLRWGSTWLEMLVQQHTTATQQQLVTVLETTALCLEHRHLQAAATALATELAQRLSCNRVSIGFLRGHRMQIRALSHTARPDVKTNLQHAIAAAMEEAVDQDAMLVFPAATDSPVQVTHAHAILAREDGNGSICSIPLIDDGRPIGALTLERPANQPFDAATVELARQIAVLAGPALELKRRDDRSLLVKAGESLYGLLTRLLGPRHPGLKLTTLTVAALLGFISIVEGDYRITADAAVEGRIQRAIVAPIDGFIKTSGFRAGDEVRNGELMGELDDRDLRLEQRKWTSEKAQFEREYRNAMAEHDRAQLAILGARIDQARARLELVNEQLARMQIVAPFDGVVVSGDLSQSLGAPVERGAVLFEVAPLDEYRLILRIDEHDIPEIRHGQSGSLRLSGLPGETLPIVVEKITPVSEAGEGRNYFRVEAGLGSTAERLRPGMEGIGKVDIEKRKLLWIWTHRLYDWLQMQVWYWLP
jgi:RND family efflux transporter MFP subunit